MQKNRIIHPLKPVINKDSKILILGSFPSVKSREFDFYYMNKNNRFWKVLSSLLNIDFTSKTKEEKINILKENHIGLYDVIYECDIIGSSDNTIENVVPTNILELIKDTNITSIYTNGSKATELFIKYNPKLKAIKLPSTSSANAQYSLEKLIKEWSIILKDL